MLIYFNLLVIPLTAIAAYRSRELGRHNTYAINAVACVLNVVAVALHLTHHCS